MDKEKYLNSVKRILVERKRSRKKNKLEDENSSEEGRNINKLNPDIIHIKNKIKSYNKDNSIFYEEKKISRKKREEIDRRFKNIVNDFYNKKLYFKTSPPGEFENLKEKFERRYSSISDIPILRALKFCNQISFVHSILVVLRCHRKSENCIFSNIYFVPSLKNNKIIKNKPEMSSCNFGPGYVSMDGEYRGNIINRMVLVNCIENFSLLASDIISYCNKIKKERGYSITRSYFYPTEDDKRRDVDLEMFLDEYRIPDFLFMFNWFWCAYSFSAGMIPNHTNKSYRSIFLEKEYMKQDVAFLMKLIKKYGIGYIESFRKNITNIAPILNPLPKHLTLKLGQKLIPLNIAEIQVPFDVRFKPWREYLIARRLNLARLFCLSPSFHFTGDWFYVKDSRANLYDNPSQVEKLIRSYHSEKVGLLIKQATKYISNIKEEEKKEGKLSYLLELYNIINEKLEEPLDIIKNDMVMSNVSLGFITEYAGRTFADILMILKKSEKFQEYMEGMFDPEGYEDFAKLIFETLYSLLVMNERFGLIHGDLHLNNISIKTQYSRSNKKLSNVKDPRIIYKAKDDVYLFKTNRWHTCLMDYSRSIIRTDKIEDFAYKPSGAKPVSNMKKFKKEQVRRMYSIHKSLYPELVKKKDEILNFGIENFDIYFKVLSACDIFKFTYSLIKVFELKHKKMIKIPRKHMMLLQEINNEANFFLTKEFNRLLYDKSYRDKYQNKKYPNQIIMKRIFRENNYKNHLNEDFKLINIYNLDNDIKKYNLDYLSKYPPFLTFDPLNYGYNNDLKYRIKMRDKAINLAKYVAERQKYKHPL